MPSTKNRYVLDSILEGFVNLGEPSGKYNNCCFAFRLPESVLEQAEADREELLDWVKTKVDNPKRLATNPPKWDDEGNVKYSFDGDTGRARPVVVDTSGDPLSVEFLKDVRRGSKVRLIVQQVPYTKPAMGTTLKVLGMQVVELASGNGAVDSGSLSADDVAEIFGTTEGFKVDQPAVRKGEVDSGYDF